MKIRFDLHNHTISSFDAYTSHKKISEFLDEGDIEVFAITEHDKTCVPPSNTRAKEFIRGCEFTEEKGAHIIGLYVDYKDLPDKSPRSIINYIKSNNGLVCIPHPYKKDSGLFNFYDKDLFINDIDLLEVLNGGNIDNPKISEAILFCSRNNIFPIASSDSHMPNQLRMCYTEIETNQNSTFRKLVQNREINSPNFYVAQNLYEKIVKKTSAETKIKKTQIIKSFIGKFLPFKVKRGIRLLNYYLFVSKDLSYKRTKFIKMSFDELKEKYI